jgi:diguanylate cyclase (GGDEF)-like protein
VSRWTRSWRPISVPTFVGALVVGAIIALFGLLQLRPVAWTSGRWLELIVFAVLTCAGELRPVRVASHAGVQEVVSSAAFAFAVFLAGGPLLAIAVQAIASVIGDLVRRKPFVKVAFNLAQYTLALSVSGVVFVLIMGDRSGATAVQMTRRWWIAAVAAGAVHFLVNAALVGTIVAVNSRASVRRSIYAMVTHEAQSDVVLLALAPIVIVVADRSLLLLPMLLLPVLFVYRSAVLSSEKEHQALHDSLTDLPNRLRLAEIMKSCLDSARARSTGGAVLLIDLDRFKEVNDTLGHRAGDALLCQVGPRIKDALPENGVIARLGGDEFAVVLPDVDADEAFRIAASITDTLQQPFHIEGFNLDVEASIGVVIYPDQGDAADVLIKNADVAMYFAKARGSVIELYDAEQDQNSHRRLSLLSELRTALGTDQVVLHYQPKLDLLTGEVTGFEGLVRWHHPTFGLIPPSDFVPFAEHTGLIRPLTNHVLRLAVAQAREWQDAGYDTSVAVNLSARVLHDRAVSDEISQLLNEYGLPPEKLYLEITESSIMADPARAKRILEQLDAMGVRLSIDDFGTGYSSLAYLQDLPIHEVKIDRSFVTNLLTNPRDRVIVRSTIDLANHLELMSTAEGIEDEATVDWLRTAGCNQGQGYSIGRPMPAPVATEWLRMTLAEQVDWNPWPQVGALHPPGPTGS